MTHTGCNERYYSSLALEPALRLARSCARHVYLETLVTG